MPRHVILLALLLFVAALSGCGDVPPTSTAEVTADVEIEVSDESPESSIGAESQTPVDQPLVMEFKPLSLSDDSGALAGNSVAGNAPTDDENVGGVIERLKPLQVMLGQWHGTTRREYEGFKAVDNHEWVWDLQTNAQQPALVLDSDKSPYLKAASITYDVASAKFRMTATDLEGTVRDFVGDYSDPVHEIVGPDDKLHRVFRLELTQTDESAAAIGGEVWQIAFAQQENDRYLLEVDKRRGKAGFRRYDTVSTQREGTSFAVSDTDYGEKECIISQGLGTISVSYQGKSYWVCCTGCKAAFEEDPATWIARAAARETK